MFSDRKGFPIQHHSQARLSSPIKLLILCILSLPWAGPLWAAVDIQPAAQAVSPNVLCDPTGELSIWINDDDFPNASPQSPVYIRMTLTGEVLLCRDHVPPVSTDTEPIYLAVGVLRTSTALGVDIPRDAVSIVRWNEEENAVWLRIQASTSTWITTASGSEAPSQENAVVFTFGIDGPTSVNYTEAQFQAGTANLPFNTRDANTSGSHGDAEDTTFELNLTSSSLHLGDPVAADFIAYVGSTGVMDPDPAQIQVGQIHGVNFTGSPVVAWVLNPVGGPASPGVLMATQPTTIYYQGDCEIGGSMSMTLVTDEFATASPSDPVYIRVGMSHNAVFASSHVIPGTPSHPIYLALSLDSDVEGAQLTADPQAVQLVRWNEGESELWVKVTRPSSDWISDPNQGLTAPSEVHRVTLTFGVSAEDSWDFNKTRFDNGLANLPSNTHNPSGLTAGDASDTTWKIDVSDSTLNPENGGDPLMTDSIAFVGSIGVETEPDRDNIVPGDLTAINFTGRSIAIAYGVDVEVNPPVAVQGVTPITFTAVTDPEVNIVSYQWTNLNTGAILGSTHFVLFDPIPTETTELELRVIDDAGAMGVSRSRVLVNPIGIDLNGDGQSTYDDLLLMLPGWSNHQYTILDLLHVNTGH